MSASYPDLLSDVHVASAPMQGQIRGQVDGFTFRLARDWPLLVVPVLLVALRIASSPSSAMAYIVAAVWSLTGRRQAILSLFFLWLFNNTSHPLFGAPLMGAVLRYVVLFAASVSVFIRGPGRGGGTTNTLLLAMSGLMCALITAHSFVFSRTPEISVLKSLTFALAFMTSLCGWAWMSPRERGKCEAIVFGSLVMIMVLSVCSLLTGGRAYLGSTSFFQGVLVHSQTLGVVAAVTVTPTIVLALIARPFRWWRVVAVGAALVCLYLSQSRAGLLGALLGLSVVASVGVIRSALSIATRNPRVVRSRLVWLAGGLMLALIFAGGSIYRRAVEFTLKRGKNIEELTSESLEASAEERLKRLDVMLANVAQHPVEGIGFGIASNESLVGIMARDPIFNLPIMATVEKGFMPAAVLEELGIPLGSLILAWLVVLGFFSSRGGSLPLVVYVTVLCSNFGESAFFSAGGNGTLLMILANWAVTETSRARPVGSAFTRRPRESVIGIP